MALHLKALDGPNKDQTFLLRSGFTIGRSEGDLVIKSDAKLSSRHAFVEIDEKAGFYLVDNNSKNGIRIDGQPVPRIKLVAGIQLNVGTYNYLVVDQSVQPVDRSKPKARFWHEILIDYAKRCLPHIENSPKAVVPLHPAVVLDFIRGSQSETRWIIGYGPRKIGAASLDLPIYERGAPKLCFEILPTPDGISFKTNHPDLVTLNGKSVEAEILRVADIIKIADTEIEVDFIE